MSVKIELLDGGKMPERKHGEESSGYDCYARDVVTIRAGKRALVPLGFRLAMPPGLEAQIRPRSGLTLTEGLMAALGTIDAGYRGEVGAILLNMSNRSITISRGDRICQMVFAAVANPVLSIGPVDVEDSSRGENGFGSTGKA